MERKLNVLTPEQIWEPLISYFKSVSVVPIVGAGLTCGMPASRETVPNGQDFQKHMLECLKEVGSFTPEEKLILESEKFSSLCDYYEDDEIVSQKTRLEYLKKSFYHIYIPENDVRRKFFEIDWPYIYSLNIDDAIENSTTYKTTILPNREFRDEIFAEEKSSSKLHPTNRIF